MLSQTKYFKNCTLYFDTITVSYIIVCYINILCEWSDISIFILYSVYKFFCQLELLTGLGVQQQCYQWNCLWTIQFKFHLATQQKQNKKMTLILWLTYFLFYSILRSYVKNRYYMWDNHFWFDKTWFFTRNKR